MNIDVSSLKTKTQEAIAKGEERLAAEARAAEAKRLAEIAEMRAKADAVLAKVPAKCEAAAAKGEKSVLVMTENRYDNHKPKFVDTGKGAKKWVTEIVGGYGLIVIEECKKAGLTVDVRHQHDGYGRDSWAEIWVSWMG